MSEAFELLLTGGLLYGCKNLTGGGSIMIVQGCSGSIDIALEAGIEDLLVLARCISGELVSGNIDCPDDTEPFRLIKEKTGEVHLPHRPTGRQK